MNYFLTLILYKNNYFCDVKFYFGGIAQLARAFDWQSKGQGFDSPYLHQNNKKVKA